MQRKTLSVCMGSACHLKGADKIVEIFLDKIEKKNLKEKIELKGSFCLGPCMDGVVIRFGDDLIKNVNVENASDVFDNEVLPKLV